MPDKRRGKAATEAAGSRAAGAGMAGAAAAPDGALARSVTIVNRRGLHARAAAKFAKLAGGFEATVEVSRNDMTVTADSIMGLMMLAAAPGCEIALRSEGREAAAALAALVALVENGFGEDD